jgi:predicted GIY-YIG superfamily endonuclease
MVIVYVLKSLRSGILYVGISENLQRRLIEHNAGKAKFTSGHIPWKLIYSENQFDFVTARKREKYLKTAAGKKWLKKYLLENPCAGGSLSQHHLKALEKSKAFLFV